MPLVSKSQHVILALLPIIGACSLKEESVTPQDAPDRISYAAAGEDCCGEDPHPVHGIQAQDGSYILGGKSIDASGNADGFLIKIDAASFEGNVFLEEDGEHQYAWSTNFGAEDGFDAANSRASIGDVVFMAGVQTLQGAPQRVLHMYDLSTGDLMAENSFPSQGESAFESMIATSSGGLILAGFVEGAEEGIEGFKSYGNPSSGTASVMYFSPAQIESQDL